MPSGTIRLTSLDKTRLSSTGAMIQAGQFAIPQEKGLLPGMYHVEIYSPDNDAPPVMVQAASGGPGLPVAPERIPKHYNVESDKTVEVTVDGDNHFVFPINSE